MDRIERKKRQRVRLISRLTLIFILLVVISFSINYAIDKDIFSPLGKILPKFSSGNESEDILRPVVQDKEISKLQSKLIESNYQLENVKISSMTADITIKLKDGPLVVFSSNKDADSQIELLQSILSRLTIENHKPKKIDFRFDKPLVNF